MHGKFGKKFEIAYMSFPRQTDRETSHMARCAKFAVARIRVKGLPLEIGEI